MGYVGGERESLFYDIKCVKWGKNKYVCHLLSRLQTRMLPAEDEKGGQSSNAPIEGGRTKRGNRLTLFRRNV